MTQKPGRELTGHTGDNEKGTPQWLFDWLDARYRFNYDAMASHVNAKAPTYSTVDGTFYRYPAGEPVQIDALDGLRQEWHRRRVFINPPYGRGIFSSAVHKMIAERNEAEIIVGLVRCDPSTEAWRLLAAHSEAITYLPRIKYAGERNPATFASAIVVMRADVPNAPRLHQ